MPWIRLDAGYLQHPRVLRAGFYGWQVHLCAILTCKTYGWPGRIAIDDFTPEYVVRAIGAENGSNVTQRYADGLVACLSAELLVIDGSHYVIRDYEQYQRDPTNAERQDRFRKARGKTARNARNVSNGIHDVRNVRNDSPPSPRGGEASPSAQEPQGKVHPLRPRERERYARVLDYVIRCGTQPEITTARERRKAIETTADDLIRARLDGEYKWVTRERLARASDQVPRENPRSAARNGPPIDDRHAERTTGHPDRRSPKEGPLEREETAFEAGGG